jgi:hypothetical protein
MRVEASAFSFDGHGSVPARTTKKGPKEGPTPPRTIQDHVIVCTLFTLLVTNTVKEERKIIESVKTRSHSTSRYSMRLASYRTDLNGYDYVYKSGLCTHSRPV